MIYEKKIASVSSCKGNWPRYRYIFWLTLFIYEIFSGFVNASDDNSARKYFIYSSTDRFDTRLSTIGCPNSGLPKFDRRSFSEHESKELSGDATLPLIVTKRRYGLSYVKYMFAQHNLQTYETHVDASDAPASMVTLFDGRISRESVSNKSKIISHRPAYDDQKTSNTTLYSQKVGENYVLYEFLDKTLVSLTWSCNEE